MASLKQLVIKLEAKSKLSSSDWRELDTMLDKLREQERRWLDDISDKQARDKERGVFVIGEFRTEPTLKEIKEEFKSATWIFTARDLTSKTLVGFCIVAKKESLGWSTCEGLYVKPEWRCKGVASELLEMAIYKTREAGLDSIDLRVSVKNRAAQALYKKLGFSRTAYQMEKWVA